MATIIFYHTTNVFFYYIGLMYENMNILLTVIECYSDKMLALMDKYKIIQKLVTYHTIASSIKLRALIVQ